MGKSFKPPEFALTFVFEDQKMMLPYIAGEEWGDDEDWGGEDEWGEDDEWGDDNSGGEDN